MSDRGDGTGPVAGRAALPRAVASAEPLGSAAMVVLALGGSVLDGLATLSLLPVVELIGVTGGGRDATAALERLLGPVGLEVTLPVALGTFLALVTLRAAVVATSGLVGVRVRLRVVDGLRRTCIEALLRAPWTFVLQRRRSDLVQVLTAEVSRVGSAVDVTARLATALCMALASVVVAVAIAPGPALLALVLAGALLLVTQPVLRRARELGLRLGAANRRFAALVTDSLESFKLVRAHRAEQRWLTDIDAAATDVRGLVEGHARAAALTGIVVEVGATAGIVAVLALWFEVSGESTAVGLVVLYAVARVLRQVSSIQVSIQQLANLLPAYRELAALTAAAEAAAADQPGAEAPGLPAADAGRWSGAPASGAPLLRLRGVTVRYPTAEAAALAAVDLVVAPRTTTALVGPSGSGKTTLADVTLGLLVPEHGVVEIDGRPADAGALAAWQRSSAYVPQEPTLLPTSLRQNLTWLAGDVADDRCWAVLDEVGATFARDLPQGLDTLVGDRGTRLSGGERQRIAIARALLREPAYLVLDEATSALDDEREQVVQAALDRLHGTLTVLVIAHRLRTVRAADQVVVMEAGRITEAGPWSTLAEDETSRFRAMLDLHGAL